MDATSWNSFFSSVEAAIRNLIQLRQEEAYPLNLYPILDQFQDILDLLVASEITVDDDQMPMRQFISEFVEVIREVCRIMEETVTHSSVRCWRLGRPRLKIDERQLEYFVESNFKVSDIAIMFDCSRRTVERRIEDMGLKRYTFITDNDLDALVRRIVQDHPYCGEKSVSSRLCSFGVRVQRQKVRDSLHRVDPQGVENRMRNVLHRRVYSVRSPNSLWHLDGYHKLIRWKFVIHGAIDGFSRLIVFLQVSNNNRATTVFSHFKKAVDEYGLPSRIRTDRGGENSRVSDFMLNHPDRGPERASVIAGRSVHNQRIERLWRDLFSGCVCFFYNLFYFLEDSGLLNIHDPLDMYSLHLVMLPAIQHQLDVFREGWAHHSLRTEHNRTPLQLWTMGFLNCRKTDVEATGLEAEVQWEQYGIDANEPVPLNDEETVMIEEIPQCLSGADSVWLQEQLVRGASEDILLRNYVVTATYIHNHYS